MSQWDFMDEHPLLFSVASPLAVLVLWEILGRLGLLNQLFFPVPTAIFAMFLEMIGTGELQENVYASLMRIFFGFFLGTIPGIILGLTMGWSNKVRAFWDPIISATYPIPKLAIFPLIMLIFGIGELSKVVIVAVGCFFLVLINSMAGVRNVNKIYFEVGKNYGASKMQVFRRIVVPASLPLVFAGIRLALGTSLLVVVGAEFVAANVGIGAMIWYSWETLDTAKLYVGIFTCAALGVLFTYVLKRVERYVIPWGEGQVAVRTNG